MPDIDMAVTDSGFFRDVKLMNDAGFDLILGRIYIWGFLPV
jgi:hypothetical protein